MTLRGVDVEPVTEEVRQSRRCPTTCHHGPRSPRCCHLSPVWKNHRPTAPPPVPQQPRHIWRFRWSSRKTSSTTLLQQLAMTGICSNNVPWFPPRSFSPVANSYSPKFISVMNKLARSFIKSSSKTLPFSPLSEVSIFIHFQVAELSWIAHRYLPFSESCSVVWRVSQSVRGILGIGITSVVK